MNRRLLFLLVALPIALFLPPMAECWSEAHVLVKRSVDGQAAKMLKQLNGKNELMREMYHERLDNMAAFAYSLMATYAVRAQLQAILNEHNVTFGSGNSTSDPLADMFGGRVPEEFTTFFRPPTDGSLVGHAERKDMECVDECLDEAKRRFKERAGNGGKAAASGKKAFEHLMLNCSDEMADHDCIVRCQKQSGGSIYTKFLLAQAEPLYEKYCPNRDTEVDLMKVFEGCKLARIPALTISFAFDFGKQFVDDFKEAEGNEQRCSAVKRILVDELSTVVGAICDKPEQSELIESLMHIGAGYALAQNTNGAIFERCPAIYNTEF